MNLDDRAIEVVDKTFSSLYGWMPAIAALAGIWIWRRYRTAGWALLALVAALRWGAGAFRPEMALPPDSQLLTWFAIALAAYGSSSAIDRLKTALSPDERSDPPHDP